MIWCASLLAFASTFSGRVYFPSYNSVGEITNVQFDPILNSTNPNFSRVKWYDTTTPAYVITTSTMVSFLQNQPNQSMTILDCAVSGQDYGTDGTYTYPTETSIVYDYINMVISYDGVSKLHLSVTGNGLQQVANSYYVYVAQPGGGFEPVYSPVAYSCIDGNVLEVDMPTNIPTYYIEIYFTQYMSVETAAGQSSYADGYNAGVISGGSSGYANGYSIGHAEGFGEGLSSGTQSGYNSGYNVGYSDGLLESGGGYTFDRLFKGIVDTPIYFLQSLFGWSMFGEGVELLTIAFTLITALVVISLLRKVFK